VALEDRAGRILRLGQFWNDKTDEWDGVPDSKFKDELGIGVDAVDWDEDSDLDLLIGSNDGHLFLRKNEGTKEKAAFATESVVLQSGEERLAVPGGYCFPSVVDWDGDGLFDVVSGGGLGGVFWFHNTGKRGEPAFTRPEILIDPGESHRLELRDPTWPGDATHACVTDFDRDGDLDVLVGDKPRNSHGWVWLFRRK
jgi:hypothetical protein